MPQNNHKRTRRCRKQIIENKFQLLSLYEIQELVVKNGEAIVLAVLPVCDPTQSVNNNNNLTRSSTMSRSTEQIEQVTYTFECPCCGFPQQVNQNNPFFTCVSCNTFFAIQNVSNALIFYKEPESNSVYYEDEWTFNFINSPIEVDSEDESK